MVTDTTHESAITVPSALIELIVSIFVFMDLDIDRKCYLIMNKMCLNCETVLNFYDS